MATYAVAGFQHETNSFTDHRADYDYFASHRDRPPLVRGQAVVDALRGGSYALSGFIDALDANEDIEPLVWASGGAGGVVTDDAFERIVGEMAGMLSLGIERRKIDGVFLDLHGAMVSERFDDAEAELLRRIRVIVGEHIPVVVSLDYHANISPEMAQFCDAMLVCKTYPHVDRSETGANAHAVLQKLTQLGRPQGRATRHSAFLLPLDFQCTLVEPSSKVVNWQPPSADGVVSFAYAAGFPPSDTRWCGPSFVAHAHTQAQADAVADAYLQFFNQLEPAFATPLWQTNEGVAQAIRLTRSAPGFVVIADTQDNPGAGGSADTTGILKALLQQNAQHALLGYLCDEAAARQACAAGVGASVQLSLGGRSGPAGVTPLEARFDVLNIQSGPFMMTGSVAGNVLADLGIMALLRCEGITIAVTSRRVQAYDPAPFHRLGVNLQDFRILALKSSCHFRADFTSNAIQVLSVLAQGAYDPDPAHYPYQKLRQHVRMQPSSAIP